MVEDIQKYQRKCHNRVERERLPWQEYFYHSTGRRNIGVHEEDGRNNSFGLGTGHDSILELVEEEKEFISPDGRTSTRFS
jgi:hypothetical protein